MNTIVPQSMPINDFDNDNNNLVLKIALKNSNIGVWEFDADSNQVNLSYESKKIIGFEDDLDFGNSPDDWNNRVHQEDRDKYHNDFQNHLKGLNPSYENEHRILCKNGTYKWIKDIGRIVDWTKDGKPNRIIGTHTDITDLKEQKLELAKSLQLISEQNHKLKNFAHIVTHNLKSHSANFESLLEFYDDADSSDEKEELIVHLKTVSSSLTKTIHNLNKIVSVHAQKEDKVKTLNIFDYINNAIKLLEVDIFKDGVQVTNNVSNDINVRFNPAYLESIFQNLLSNAIKYKHPDKIPTVLFSSEIKDDDVIIKVEDNGLGIDLDKYGNDIFNLYKTFHNNENAEGVGLYLVKNQIESFGGTISIKSMVNVGTTFTITLPIKED